GAGERSGGAGSVGSAAASGAEGMELPARAAGFLALDARASPELEAEGMARDAVRASQGSRKRLDLHISDRIAVIVEASAEVTAALETHSELIAGETLATSLEFGSAEGAAQV